jgi:hypothetical protein
MLSERRGSNPRPRPWQGRALPTELLSHCIPKRIAKLMNAPYNSSKTCFFLLKACSPHPDIEKTV